MVLTEKEAVDASALAKKQNLFLMEAMWSRFLPCYITAKKWISDGRIGEPILADGYFCFESPEGDGTGRLYNDKLGAGAAYDLGIYPVHMIPFLVSSGLADGSAAIRRAATTGIDKTCALSLTMKNGVIASVRLSMEYEDIRVLKVFGTDGRVEVDGIANCKSARLFSKNGELLDEVHDERENGFVYQILEMQACLKAKKTESEIMPHKDTAKAIRLINKILKK
jgi:predicted dehydrogenase